MGHVGYRQPQKKKTSRGGSLGGVNPIANNETTTRVAGKRGDEKEKIMESFSRGGDGGKMGWWGGGEGRATSKRE